MTESDHRESAAALETALRDATRIHLEKARCRVPEVYARHLASPSAIRARHRRAWRDIPQDLLSLPRLLWRLFLSLRGHTTQQPALSRKERELLGIMESELLDLEGWYRSLSQVLITADASIDASSPEKIEHMQRAVRQYLEGEMVRIAGPREGTRDLLVFLLVGLGSQTVSDSVTFGSALALGMTLATGWYLSSLSWWDSLWSNWLGVPAWVEWAGAVGGSLAAVALVPVLAPWSEWLVNRLRGPRFLEEWLTEIEAELLRPKRDTLDRASPLGTLSQILPDLLAVLHKLR